MKTVKTLGVTVFAVIIRAQRYFKRGICTDGAVRKRRCTGDEGRVKVSLSDA